MPVPALHAPGALGAAVAHEHLGAPDLLDVLARALGQPLAGAEDELQGKGAALLGQLGKAQDPGDVADEHVVAVLLHALVDVGDGDLARAGHEGPELGDRAREPGPARPVVVVLGAEHPVLRANADVVEADGHERGGLFHLAVRVVERLSLAGGAARLVDELRRLAEEGLGAALQQVLGARGELAQLGGVRDALDVHAVLPEELAVEGRVLRGVPQRAPQLPQLDALHAGGRARPRGQAVGRPDRTAVEEARGGGPHRAQQQPFPHA